MRAHTACIALTCLMLTCGAQAQDGKASKEREALRRAQTALRAAQEQQSTLQADKVKAESAAQQALKDAASARAQASSQGARVKALDAQVAALQAQALDLRQALAAAQAASGEAQARERDLQRQLAVAADNAATRLRTAQSLATLLERSHQALADAEAKNHRLQDIAQDLIKLYASRTTVDAVLLADRVTGLAAVRLEDQAERLRQQVEQQGAGGR